MSTHDRTVTAVFASYELATQAVRDLESAGFDHTNVAIVTRDPGAHEGIKPDVAEHRADADEELAVEGAEEGIAVGAGAGLLTALAVALFPGTLFLVGGWLAAAEIGVMFGMAGGLGAALVKSGTLDRHAQAYVQAVENGHTLVSVRCMSSQVADAEAVMARTAITADGFEVLKG